MEDLTIYYLSVYRKLLALQNNSTFDRKLLNYSPFYINPLKGLHSIEVLSKFFYL